MGGLNFSPWRGKEGQRKGKGRESSYIFIINSPKGRGML